MSATSTVFNQTNPDPDQGDEKILDAVRAEINKITKDIPEHHKAVMREINGIRDKVEASKGETDAFLREEIAKVTTAVSTHQDAMEKQVADLRVANDEAVRIAQRAGLGGGGNAGANADQVRDATLYENIIRARGQPLDISRKATANDVDPARYQETQRCFDTMLRTGPQHAPQEVRNTLHTGSSPDGGYWILPEMARRILEIAQEYDPIRSLATIEVIGTSEIQFPVDDSEAEALWADETSNRPDTAGGEVGQQTIAVNELTSKPKVSKTLLEDGMWDVLGWVTRKAGNAFAKKEGNSFILGNGVKRPRGLLTYPAGTGRGKVAQFASGAAASITSDAIVKLPFQLKDPYSANSSWLMQRATVASVMLLKDNDGRYMWQPNIQIGQPATLAGYPVRTAPSMPALEADSLSVAFGDIRAAYTIVDRLAMSMLVDPLTADPFVKYPTRKRVGGDITNFEALVILKTTLS